MRGTTLALLLLVAVTPGCGPSSVRVSGEVTCAGKPIENGEITFVAGTFSTAAPIRDGRYEVSAARGLVAGKTYRVEILGLRKSAKTIVDPLHPSGPRLEVVENYLPPEYNVRSELTATAAGSDVRVDFALPARP